MLYVFHVDTGATLTFDIKLALQTVGELKEAIERECGVLAVHQVLLMSGGENVDLVEQITASLAMPATYATLVARAQLAQQCCAIARDQTRTCERLVHDQHLQQQGWAAVVANLEDITQMFKSKADLLQQSFTQYLAERQQHMQLLNNFNKDLDTLSKIPILPALRAQAEGLLSVDDGDEIIESNNCEVMSLLRWISAKDNQSSLEQVAEQCSRGLEQFDERMMEALKSEVNAAIDASNKPEMKEIKGLGERLFALEQLMAQTKRLVQEQGELAQGFHQNQTRANNLGDASVLPDLCASHRKQLAVMMENYSQLRDIRRRCTRAKEELSVNIYQRLKWIMYVENKMMEVNGKLVMYHENLKRLRRHLEVLLQIHLAPQMYVSAVSEVVRRRTFSQAFLVWASNLACQLLTVHNEEIARRREFQSKFDGHFLNSLFPGLEDVPPSFATQAPTVFDNGLPKLTADDMESLKIQLPDLTDSISTPDLNSITQFFLSKSLTSVTSSEENNINKIIKEDDNTDEFEKISQQNVSDSNSSSSKQQQERVNTYEKKLMMPNKQLEVGCSQSSISPAMSLSLSTNISTSANKSSRLIDLNHIKSSSSSSSSSSTSSNSLDRNKKSVARFQTTNNYSSSQELKNSSTPPCPIPTSSVRPVTCDGQQQLLQVQQDQQQVQICRQIDSGGSSPFADPSINNDFINTEFYIDESLPSSLSEHPNDAGHAIVSLLQENLGNTRSEVERLRTILRTLKLAMNEAISAFKSELNLLREKVNTDKNGIIDVSERMNEALILHSRECERILREREQELTVDHELELADAKKLIQARDDEIRNLEASIEAKDTEFTELRAQLMRQKLDNSQQEEMCNLQTRYQSQLNEALEQARMDKENALARAREASLIEKNALMIQLEECRKNIRELEDTLAKTRADQSKLIKEATDKLQAEHKNEFETMKGRFKLMTASSVMERSPSDSSLEKIETRENLESEKAEAVRQALVKESSDFEAKLQYALALSTKKLTSELESQRLRETVLVDQCRQYQEMIRRLTEEDHSAHQVLKEKVSTLEAENFHLESKMSADRKMLKQREAQLHDLETQLSTSKDDIDVSESKKVRLESKSEQESLNLRLEAKSETDSLTRRLEILEVDNKRLSAELKASRESRDSIETRVEALEADKVRLEIELVKERALRGFAGRSLGSVSDSGMASSIESRDKDMIASVAVVEAHEELAASKGIFREKLIKSTNSLLSQFSISLHTCNTGDCVVVLWDSVHTSYIVLQESTTMYFLHSDCVDLLGLKTGSDGIPKQIYVIGEVIDKQYCHAKKKENRYHVPQGTKFYRVRVKPLQRDCTLIASSSEKNQQ
ncbi:Similar to RB1CC1: RB1-inducible coiled-coil protein 1 (Homo sapiens) [Cotesia congregata]|uniref:Similar to RB1CC1: RB1-inducible coiled-coil protein 1 (Homo sapiens) n=1 Tax=Cotesia congregata TaxID=51543 RepID=A0A8J2H8M5_COTCN|nr:Similar to RB1CC1: RB1-inducible coiled-coil protein 1 (Homo sapiens) [Cotesia congregata]